MDARSLSIRSANTTTAKEHCYFSIYFFFFFFFLFPILDMNQSSVLCTGHKKQSLKHNLFSVARWRRFLEKNKKTKKRFWLKTCHIPMRCWFSLKKTVLCEKVGRHSFLKPTNDHGGELRILMLPHHRLSKERQSKLQRGLFFYFALFSLPLSFPIHMG